MAKGGQRSSSAEERELGSICAVGLSPDSADFLFSSKGPFPDALPALTRNLHNNGPKEVKLNGKYKENGIPPRVIGQGTRSPLEVAEGDVGSGVLTQH